MEDKKVIMQVENLNKEFVIHGKKLMEPKKMLHALSDVSFDRGIKRVVQRYSSIVLFRPSNIAGYVWLGKSITARTGV